VLCFTAYTPKKQHESSGAKADYIMLVKLTFKVNFTNILRTAFTLADPKSAKKYLQLDSIFCTFGICAHKRCVCKRIKVRKKTFLTSNYDLLVEDGDRRLVVLHRDVEEGLVPPHVLS